MCISSLAHLTACWITTLFSAFALFLLLIFTAALQSTRYAFLPICKQVQNSNVSNNSQNIFLVHYADKLSAFQYKTIEDVIKCYPNFTIHLTILEKPPSSLISVENRNFEYANRIKYYDDGANMKSDDNYEVKRVKREGIHYARLIKPRSKFFDWFDNGDFDINIGSKNLLKMLMKRKYEVNRTSLQTTTTQEPKITDVKTLKEKYPKMIFKNLTAVTFFQRTPLHRYFYLFPEEMQTFAARVLLLWDYSGLSFDVEGTDKKVRDLIEVGLKTFGDLPEGIVTVDDEGLHMETKTTCHAFFGEMIANLKILGRSAKISEVIKRTLKSFCLRGAVDAKYCENMRP